MVRTPINYLIIEGPDLSGKTTLYNSIHKATGYRWNIQDRSALSMLVHAKYYNRTQFSHVENLRSEVMNLNNHVIILLPSWEVIVKRFESRGDEIQNLASLRKIYDLFAEATEEFENYPNFTVVRSEVDDYIVKEVVKSLVLFEHEDTYSLSERVKTLSSFSADEEATGVNLTFFDDCSFKSIIRQDLSYEKEKAYYDEIKRNMLKKIDDEFRGINEYQINQDENSRRFIYTSDTCISLIHYMLREDVLDCKFFMRSSDTKDILKYDLNFLVSLTKDVHDYLSEIYKSKIKFCRLNLLINSAHLPSIIEDNIV